MPRLEYLDERTRRAILYFPCEENDSAPWTPLARDLSQCRVALVTSAALHLRSDAPFPAVEAGQGDPSFRVIPSKARASEIIQSHHSIGFDRTGFYRDVNVVFPIDRLREMAERSEIGSVAENSYSFHGATQRNTGPMVREMGPEIASRLKGDGVDLVLLTPV